MRIFWTFRYVLLITAVNGINGKHDIHEMSNYRSASISGSLSKFEKPIAHQLMGQRAFVNDYEFSNRREGTSFDESNRVKDPLFKDLANSRDKYVRQNRAIESTVENVIDRDFIRGSSKDYSSSNSGFLSHSHEDRFPPANYPSQESETWNQYDNQNDYFDVSDNDSVRFEKFLNDLSKKRTNGELDDLNSGTRQGRRRKLNSQEQGILLVEALRKKRNFTYVNDHRGHGSDIQSGIMDMLGKSMLRQFFFPFQFISFFL